MTEILKLPIGIENFQEIRRDNFYYIDKTKLIESLLNWWGLPLRISGISGPTQKQENL